MLGGKSGIAGNRCLNDGRQGLNGQRDVHLSGGQLVEIEKIRYQQVQAIPVAQGELSHLVSFGGQLSGSPGGQQAQGPVHRG